jgi:hypothetical protein
MNYIPIFCCGFFGGTAPSLLELAGKAQAENLPGSGYYLALIIFGAIGGGIAIIYKEVVSHKAFLLGVSAPALIVTAGAVADQKTVSIHDLFPISSAYAQDLNLNANPDTVVAEWASNLDNGKIIVVPIEPNNFGGTSVDANALLRYQTPNTSGNAILFNAAEFTSKYGNAAEFTSKYGNAAVEADSKNNWYAVVPNESTSTSLSGSVTALGQTGAIDVWQVETESVAIPATAEPAKFEFKRSPTFWSGFYDALGMETRAKMHIEYPATIENIHQINESIQ